MKFIAYVIGAVTGSVIWYYLAGVKPDVVQVLLVALTAKALFE